MIDFNKPVQTKDGREVRIYAQDGEGAFPIHGAVKTDRGWEILNWNTDGKATSSRSTHPYDLVNVPEKRRLTGWVNVYGDGMTAYHTTQRSAEVHADTDRIACVRIDIEYTIGQGL